MNRTYVNEDGSCPVVIVPRRRPDGSFEYAQAPKGKIEVPGEPTFPGAVWDFETRSFIEELVSSEERRANLPSLTARQFRLGLLSAECTFGAVEAAIAAIADDIVRENAMVEWEYAVTFNRTHPLVISLSAALGFTPEEVDSLWEDALAL